ncbi:DNA polymerase III subunit alpha, partial [bacterium]|nr:DNA polymerase III subunit alpha [candidate division CSSED10-310 bacterium]
LNPERVSMPDFDIDFCMNRREEVIHYVADKYGHDKVGQIITFNCMKAKAVIRDVGRALKVPLSEVDRLAKLVPNDPKITLQKAMSQEVKLRELITKNAKYKELFDIAERLEGLNRHSGVHAAGVVISEEPLWETVPVKREGDNDLVTQYAKDEVEKAGLVKFDFLGLKTLTVIDLAQKMTNQIKTADKKPLDIRYIPLDDKEVYDQISTGDTYGIFQMESSGFQEMIRRMKPSCFEDIIAAVALYRPGPMDIIPDFIARKHGQQTISYPHPSLEYIVKDTYGLIVYQEQVMQISRVMAGFSLGYADLLRRAMGKKKPDEMAKMRSIFINGDAETGTAGAVKLGYDPKLAGDVFDLMEKFAGYGFNKSHAAGYAVLSYQTAFLKRNYPKEFMAALMSCDYDKTDKVVKAINECNKMDIQVLPPDVNSSGADFTVVEEGIRFGLAAVKNVGLQAVEAIRMARDEAGPFTSLFEFCKRVDLKSVNRRAIESLVKCGAFDSLNVHRSQLITVLDQAFEMGQKEQRDKSVGQVSLFDVFSTVGEQDFSEPPLPDISEWSTQEKLAYEKETLGFYITGHPLLRVKREIESLTTHNSVTLKFSTDLDKVVIGGLVVHVKRYVTKTKEQMAFITLEDLSGFCEVIVRPKEWVSKRDLLESDEIIIVEGTISINDAQVRLVAEDIMNLEQARRKIARFVSIELASPEDHQIVVDKFHYILGKYQGNALIQFVVDFPYDTRVEKVILDLGQDYSVDPSDGFVDEIVTIPCVKDVHFR